MKAVLLLFGIYLLALGCLPCADDECAGQENKVEVKTASSNNCPSEESCPPFCTCSCCSIQIVSPAVITASCLPLQQSADTRINLYYSHSLLSGMGNSIWQPPRLG